MKKRSADSQPLKKIVWLTSEDFEYLCFDFTREYMTFDEPIPDYETRDAALLESSLGSPTQTFGGKFLYPTLTKQASVLFYSLIKNHPFKNGNKRIAVISLLTFLSLNQKWLLIEPYVLYKLAKSVAETKPAEHENSLKVIEKTITENLIPFPIRKS